MITQIISNRKSLNYMTPKSEAKINNVQSLTFKTPVVQYSTISRRKSFTIINGTMENETKKNKVKDESLIMSHIRLSDIKSLYKLINKVQNKMKELYRFTENIPSELRESSKIRISDNEKEIHQLELHLDSKSDFASSAILDVINTHQGLHKQVSYDQSGTKATNTNGKDLVDKSISCQMTHLQASKKKNEDENNNKQNIFSKIQGIFSELVVLRVLEENKTAYNKQVQNKQLSNICVNSQKSAVSIKSKENHFKMLTHKLVSYIPKNYDKFLNIPIIQRKKMRDTKHTRKKQIHNKTHSVLNKQTEKEVFRTLSSKFRNQVFTASLPKKRQVFGKSSSLSSIKERKNIHRWFPHPSIIKCYSFPVLNTEGEIDSRAEIRSRTSSLRLYEYWKIFLKPIACCDKCARSMSCKSTCISSETLVNLSAPSNRGTSGIPRKTASVVSDVTLKQPMYQKDSNQNTPSISITEDSSSSESDSSGSSDSSVSYKMPRHCICSNQPNFSSSGNTIYIVQDVSSRNSIETTDSNVSDQVPFKTISSRNTNESLKSDTGLKVQNIAKLTRKNANVTAYTVRTSPFSLRNKCDAERIKIHGIETKKPRKNKQVTQEAATYKLFSKTINLANIKESSRRSNCNFSDISTQITLKSRICTSSSSRNLGQPNDILSSKDQRKYSNKTNKLKNEASSSNFHLTLNIFNSESEDDAKISYCVQ